jgi:hypothetical protein
VIVDKKIECYNFPLTLDCHYYFDFREILRVDYGNFRDTNYFRKEVSKETYNHLNIGDTLKTKVMDGSGQSQKEVDSTEYKKAEQEYNDFIKNYDEFIKKYNAYMVDKMGLDAIEQKAGMDFHKSYLENKVQIEKNKFK